MPTKTARATPPPAPMTPLFEADRVARIGPAALVTARWSLLAVASGLVVAELLWPGLWGEQPLAGVWAPLGVVVLWGGVNLYAARSTGPYHATPEGQADAGRHLLLDIALLTALLALTGGANNPFTMLYFLPITLATLMSRSWTWRVALAAVCGFAVLVAVSTWTMNNVGHAAHAAHHHAAPEHSGHFWRHLVGMGVALAVAGSLVTYFVHKIAGVLTAQRGELERLRREVHEDRYAASLGALSAGAAHELGTPLGTIQLLTGELEWMDEQERHEAAALIRRELDRCKDILHGMKNPELSARALEAPSAWSVEELCADLRASEAPPGVQLRVRLDQEGPGGAWGQPRGVVEQTVRELITNATRSAIAGQPLEIEVCVCRTDEELLVAVCDNGRGMSEDELALVFEPFFSNHEGGRGLGLFLARLHMRQLGGSLRLVSRPGEGTRAEVRLPPYPPGWLTHDGSDVGARGERAGAAS